MRPLALLIPLLLALLLAGDAAGSASARCFPGQQAVRSADGAVAIHGRSICVAGPGGVTIEPIAPERIAAATAIHRIGNRYLIASVDARRRERWVAAFGLHQGHLVPACGFFDRRIYGTTDHGSMVAWIQRKQRGRFTIVSDASGVAITAEPTGATPVTIRWHVPKDPLAAVTGPCVGPPLSGDHQAFEKAARAIE